MYAIRSYYAPRILRIGLPDKFIEQGTQAERRARYGLDEMPSGDRNELFAAIRMFFQRLADEQTTVLLFEDLHWAVV